MGIKYEKYDIVLQEEGENAHLESKLDNKENDGTTAGAYWIELDQKVSGCMNSAAAKVLGYNLENKEAFDELKFLIFCTRPAQCGANNEYEFENLRVLVIRHMEIPEDVQGEMRETTSASEILPNCTWHKYGDGSGYLEGPRKVQKLVSYDLTSKEYQINKEWYELVDCNTSVIAIQQMEVVLCKIMNTFIKLYINWYGSCDEDAHEATAETGENANDRALQKFLKTAKEEELVGYMLYSTGGQRDAMSDFLQSSIPGVSGKKKENIGKILTKMFVA